MKNKEDYNAICSEIITPDYQVGTISKLYGTKGELVVKLWDTFPHGMLGEPLWVEIDTLPVPLWIGSFQKQGNTKAVIVFDDFESEPLSRTLLGKAIYSARAEIEQEDEHPLVGMRFEDLTSSRSGEIVDYIDSEMNPLLVVELADMDQEVLIPYNEKFVVDIKKRKGVVVFELPEAIFDLND